MSDSQFFFPKRTPGLILHLGLGLLMLGGAGFFFYNAFLQPGGVFLVLYLTGALILLAVLPLIVYRGYALLHANYELQRDGLRLHWGLRVLDIPLSEVEWVRPADDLQVPLKLPAFSMPGAILGQTIHPDLGKIEFIASSSDNLVIVAAMDRVVILSPEEEDNFLKKVNRTIEMGTLTPIRSLSVEPGIFIRNIFSDRLARLTIPLGFGLWFILLIIISVLIPNMPSISLGYDASGTLLEPVAGVRMLILPIIGIFLYAISLIGGAYFFRKEENRPVSQMLWLGGAVTPLLLLIATLLFTLKV
jgi:hypothetical protein